MTKDAYSNSEYFNGPIKCIFKACLPFYKLCSSICILGMSSKIPTKFKLKVNFLLKFLLIDWE